MLRPSFAEPVVKLCSATPEEGCSYSCFLKQMQWQILDKSVCPALFRNTLIIFSYMLCVSTSLRVISAPKCMITANESRWKFGGCSRAVTGSSMLIWDHIMHRMLSIQTHHLCSVVHRKRIRKNECSKWSTEMRQWSLLSLPENIPVHLFAFTPVRYCW